MALLTREYCRYCERETDWVDLRKCAVCGCDWSTVQEAIAKRDEDRALRRRADATGRLAGAVDFVTMKPMRRK
jgi:hypothetical protein